MNTRWSGFSSCTALSLAARSATSYLVSPRKTSPWAFTDTTSGSSLPPTCWALVFGRSTGTPTCRSGAVTMKMISSTSMTSTSGVTLMSAIGVKRRRLNLLLELTAPAAGMMPAIRLPPRADATGW